MPDLVNVTVPTEAEKFDLRTAEGAWVMLKPLPYGELLERRDKASRMSMEMGTRRGKRQDTARADIDTMQHQTRIYEFTKCIVDHNLSDDKGNKLNFTNPATLGILSPKTGQEIEELIDKLNELEEVDEEDFPSVPTSSTPTTLNSRNDNTETLT